MSATMAPTADDILLAVLHKVGPDVRLRDDFKLAQVFNCVAEEFGEPFKQFRWHRHYHVSDLLSETLQLLDHHGSIVRENAAQTYFRVTPHAAGPYGESVFESLPQEWRDMVGDVAERIRKEFRASTDVTNRTD